MSDVRGDVLAFALSLPATVEKFPWGESAVKVRGKGFVFFGSGTPGRRMTVKLVESHPHALSIEGAEPTRYGLGPSGWVTVPLDTAGTPVDVLCDWVEESYRIIAPKSLVAELDDAS